MAFSAYVGRLSVQNPLAFLAWMSGFLSGDVSSLWQRLIGSRSDTVRFSLRRWSACVWLPLASTAALLLKAPSAYSLCRCSSEFGNQLPLGGCFLCRFDDENWWDSLIKNRWTSLLEALAVSGGFGVSSSCSAMTGDDICICPRVSTLLHSLTRGSALDSLNLLLPQRV
ncbi:hypothetical protein ARALYDRAFT_338115 [Arabidopsis lyrata subsp. lyrata]|uniref:Uncharacterized protein n=1 Tax=Arabidopsis lyrata subsp. lyrata TaxID=81972 RepID=D7KUN1_ARALL|nr:hypothetical protein ARALYDRAFT_338115 [Arabidopsis lyrata subsp. lyrata]